MDKMLTIKDLEPVIKALKGIKPKKEVHFVSFDEFEKLKELGEEHHGPTGGIDGVLVLPHPYPDAANAIKEQKEAGKERLEMPVSDITFNHLKEKGYAVEVSMNRGESINVLGVHVRRYPIRFLLDI